MAPAGTGETATHECGHGDHRGYGRRSISLHVPHPLVLHVRRPDEHLVAVHDEPDFDLVGLPGFPPVVRQDQGLLAASRFSRASASASMGVSLLTYIVAPSGVQPRSG